MRRIECLESSAVDPIVKMFSWQIFYLLDLIIQPIPSNAVLRIAANPFRIRPAIRTLLSAIPKRSAE
jgi:hypothetical protein